MRDLSQPRITAIREAHGPSDISSVCRACGQPLPCDALFLAEEVDRHLNFETVQRNERRRLEQRLWRFRNVYQRTADVLYGFWVITFIIAPMSDLDSPTASSLIPRYRLVSNPEEWKLAGISALGVACMMYGVSRLMLRETPAKRTGFALLLVGACILGVLIGEVLILNRD